MAKQTLKSLRKQLREARADAKEHENVVSFLRLQLKESSQVSMGRQVRLDEVSKKHDDLFAKYEKLFHKHKFMDIDLRRALDLIFSLIARDGERDATPPDAASRNRG